MTVDLDSKCFSRPLKQSQNWPLQLARGYDTPFLNRTIFKATSRLLGARLRMILCGGAPLR